MKSSKTIALIIVILILGGILGYIAYLNYQEDLARYFRFQGAKFIQSGEQIFLPSTISGLVFCWYLSVF